MRLRMLLFAAAVPAAALFAVEDLPRGEIIDNVQCLADATQSYALYLPLSYTPGRRWSVIVGLDAGGRGQLARRVLRGFTASARGSKDADLDALLEQIRPASFR